MKREVEQKDPYYKEYYRKNKEIVLEKRKLKYNKEINRKNYLDKKNSDPEKHRKYLDYLKEYRKNNIIDIICKTYKISKEFYYNLLESQNGVCGLCKSEFKDTDKNRKDMVIDHCHATGKVRGILCRKCNTGLGLFNEDPDLLLKSYEYIKKHRE